ncbi:MAG: hypothetical protein KBT01_04740 [Clostridiales bacterium]|nr:hypothetical protein [Candidatus Blautia equi]
MKDWLSEILWAAAIVALSLILRENTGDFWFWYLAVTALGLIAMPLCGRLFRNFEDRGWMFSKVLGTAGMGFLTWWLVSVKALPFTTLTCFLVCGGCLLISAAVFCLKPSVRENIKSTNYRLVLAEEMIFLLAFLLWTYLAGFTPAAHGTEKYMDYGFMESMMRSTVMPPRDFWYSEGHLNYYYGGQYFAVFLTKLAGREVKVTYNLMRSFVAGLAFVLPFSLVYQMTLDYLKHSGDSDLKTLPTLSGLLGGTAVSLTGNMHYVVYGFLLPIKEMLQGVPSGERTGYWFPDATRYIGYNPDVPDKTIHEFPSYSFVLGDLHAHVVNIMFVLLLIGLLYAYTVQKRSEERGALHGVRLYVHEIFNPQILVVSVLLGMFQWTNFWDFVIYFVVCGGTVLFTNIVIFDGRISRILPVTLAQAILVMGLSYLVILPFTLQFTTMVNGVAFAKHHSLWYQLLILWGLPTVLVTVFIGVVIYESIKKAEKKRLSVLMDAASFPDLFTVILGLCAMGLVLIPELVYVRDIYEDGNARASTMFKLTYQAYILFGIAMGYLIGRLIISAKSVILLGIVSIGLVCLVFTTGYFLNSVESWFGNVTNLNGYEGLDATAYMEFELPEDVKAIRWLREEIKGAPVVLEANGNSYADYDNRVSAMTGLPTVLGWYVHEWLWRNETEDLNVKNYDIETIYTSGDEEEVRGLLTQYDVSYIFVGSVEKYKYGDRLQESLLRSRGTVVFEDDAYGTCIIMLD